jgi:acetolactate synthase-1/2/3 large subunit
MVRYQRVQMHPGVADIEALRLALEAAKKPFLLIGGSGWTETALQQMQGFAERFDLPVGVAWRRLECFDQRHGNFAGHVGWGMTDALRQQVLDADVLLAVGTRLGEATTIGYSLVQSPQPRQQLIHVYPDPDELGRVFRPALGMAASAVGFAAAVAQLQPLSAPAWSAATRAANAAYRDSLVPLPTPSVMSLDQAAAHVNSVLPADACVTVGAGNYALYPHRYRQFGGIGSSLAPTVGSMGYGLPAAISAKLEDPARTVVCYAGDGCFQMNMQELGVAMQYRVGIVILVFNNGMWGTIRAHQEREFPARTIALNFDNPEFTQIVQAYGGYGEVVTDNEQFVLAFQRALAFAERERLPALLEIRYDADGIAPGETLSAIRARAEQAQREQVKA